MKSIQRVWLVNARLFNLNSRKRKFLSTITVKTLFVAAICLTFAEQAYSTAIYNANASLKVGFNQTADSYTTPSEDYMSGTGNHYESPMHSRDWDRTGDFWYSLQAYVEGWAGDATGTLDGTSEVSSTTKWVFNFLFPAASATTLTLTRLDSNVQTNITAPLLGESGYSQASISMLLDGNDIWFGNDNKYSANLTGSHSITLIAYAAGSVSASYQPVPEPATMLLFGTGLAGLTCVVRRKKKA